MSVVSTNYSSTTDTTALAITIAALGNSTSHLIGRESTVVDNTTNKFVDALVSGQITVGTGPTANTGVVVYVYAPLKVTAGAFTYPIASAATLTGLDAAATFDADQRSGLKWAATLNASVTSDRAYSFSFSVAALFGGMMPLKWGIWVSNGTGVALNATAGNHWVHYTGVKYDVL